MIYEKYTNTLGQERLLYEVSTPEGEKLLDKLSNIPLPIDGSDFHLIGEKSDGEITIHLTKEYAKDFTEKVSKKFNVPLVKVVMKVLSDNYYYKVYYFYDGNDMLLNILPEEATPHGVGIWLDEAFNVIDKFNYDVYYSLNDSKMYSATINKGHIDKYNTYQYEDNYEFGNLPKAHEDIKNVGIDTSKFHF